MDLLDFAVAQERDLVWHDDPLRYPYLRQAERLHSSRTRPIGRGEYWSTGIRIVGYSILRPTAFKHQNRWVRRVFWCKLADRNGTRTDPPVREAVDPRAIRVRERTPWLLEDDEGTAALWLIQRRRALHLGPGMTVSP